MDEREVLLREKLGDIILGAIAASTHPSTDEIVNTLFQFGESLGFKENETKKILEAASLSLEGFGRYIRESLQLARPGPNEKRCPRCHGTRTVTYHPDHYSFGHGFTPQSHTHTCSTCNGKGVVPNTPPPEK